MNKLITFSQFLCVLVMQFYISGQAVASANNSSIYHSVDKSVALHIHYNSYINRVIFKNSEESCVIELNVTRLQGKLFTKASANYATFQWRLPHNQGGATISGMFVLNEAAGSSYITWNKRIRKDDCLIQRTIKVKRIIPTNPRSVD